MSKAKKGWSMTLKARDLLRAHELIVLYLEEIEQDTIEIDDDYYWHIQSKPRYDVGKTPNPDEFSVGQLSEDASWIRGILDDPEKATGHALVWLGTLLRAYGERVRG
jgi:hypothetical protein